MNKLSYFIGYYNQSIKTRFFFSNREVKIEILQVSQLYKVTIYGIIAWLLENQKPTAVHYYYPAKLTSNNVFKLPVK
jgi:hypothetical protein